MIKNPNIKMSLKQLSNKDRILFLREFSLQLVAASAKDEELKELIRIEKLKRKYLEGDDKIPDINLIYETKEHETKDYEIKEPQVKTSEKYQPPLLKYNQPARQFIKPVKQAKPIFKKIPTSSYPQKPLSQPTFQPSKPVITQTLSPTQLSQPITTQAPQQPPPQPPTKQLEGLEESVMKLNPLIRDQAVQMIECPGAGKNILVKAKNKMNITRIILNENEIKNIINYFSRSSKIPIVGGILKAALDNLLISAVVSEYVGSRFIITKKSPYELIEGFQG